MKLSVNRYMNLERLKFILKQQQQQKNLNMNCVTSVFFCKFFLINHFAPQATVSLVMRQIGLICLRAYKLRTINVIKA